MSSSHTHIRSISLPSRFQVNCIEAELNNLKTLETSSASSRPIHAVSETLQIGFARLAELYDSIEKVVQSPLTQQALCHQQNVKLVEEALDGSVGLLDACGVARDLILMMKEQEQDLQSALRRRGADSRIQSSIHAYLSFRKKLRRDMTKSLRALRRLESNICSFPLSEVDYHLLMLEKALRESSAITISTFRSLLLLFSMPVMKRKAGGWSVLSKLIPGAAERGHKCLNEVETVDIALCTLQQQIRKNDAKIDVQMELRSLETLDASIRGLDAGLHCLFRCLIKNRVSLLNIFTP